MSTMLKEPVRVPVAVGVKVTLTIQLVVVAKVVPQLLVCVKSPLAVMLERLAAALPVLDIVTG